VAADGLSGTPRQGGGSATADQASPGLKIRALTSVLEVIAPAHRGDSHMAGKRILLLEDEPDIAELLALALDGEGYVVDLAATVAEARTRLDTLVYTLVIADLRLPDGDGLEIAERAADLGAATFIMSGYLFQLERGAATRHELLMKPLRPSELVEAVRCSIGSPQEA
jgi:DNA-binding response OmpR family regulator